MRSTQTSLIATVRALAVLRDWAERTQFDDVTEEQQFALQELTSALGRACDVARAAVLAFGPFNDERMP